MYLSHKYSFGMQTGGSLPGHKYLSRVHIGGGVVVVGQSFSSSPDGQSFTPLHFCL